MTRIIKLVLFFLILGFYSVKAQLPVERKALNNLNKKRWDRSYVLLQKAIRKDSLNAVAEYICGRYFFSADNPNFHLDSAYHHSQLAYHHLSGVSPKQRARLKRFLVDSTNVFSLIKKIDSTAFEFAKQVNTEQAYLHFLKRFQDSRYYHQATELRDEAAYADALHENTYESFSAFLEKYPQSSRREEAKKNYEKLLFEYKTQDKLLTSYESFLHEFPNTEYRKEIERNIFEISTASGEEEKITSFLKKYPNSYFSNKARRLLYHIISESDSLIFPAGMADDSIQHIATLAQHYLVPFLKDGKFGFLDDEGHEVVSPTLEDIPKKYCCGNLTQDVIILYDRILAKDGSLIYQGNTEQVDDLGFGFLKITQADTIQVIHKSGFRIKEPSIEDAKLLNGRFLVLKNTSWSLFTLAGRRLTPYEWDDIYNLNDIIVFKKDGKSILATPAQVALLANQQNLKTKDSFNEVKLWKHNLIWAKAASFEGVFDCTLRVVIPFEKQSLTQVFFGVTGSSPAGVKAYNLNGGELGIFQDVKINMPWFVVKQAGNWRYFNTRTSKCENIVYDSVSFTGPFAIGFLGDSTHLYFTTRKTLNLYKAHCKFIPGKDSTSFLRIDQGEKKYIYDAKGQKLFAFAYDKIQYLTEDVFIVSKKEKKGLMSKEGRVLLPPEFDAIGTISDHTISLLKNKKFGMFDLLQLKQIKPQYDKNIVRYDNSVMIGFKNGFYGFIDYSSNSENGFEFDEIKYWNDSEALVRKGGEWMLYDIVEKKTLLDKIRDYKIISNRGNEIIGIFHRESDFGVLSNRRGFIIPANFSDIKNLGSSDKPFYFTEKHIKEASIFVVIYYSASGNPIARHVYEQDDYERIYCSDN